MSERRAGNDGRSFARRTGLITLGQASVKATQLMVAVLLVRMMSAADWNQVAFLLSVYLAGTTIGTLNIHHSIVFFLPRVTVGQRRPLVIRNMQLLGVFGVLLVIGLTLGAPSIGRGVLDDPGLIAWLGVAIAMELPAACIAMTLISTDRITAAALWDLVGSVLTVGATVGPVVAGLGIPGLVGGLVTVGVLRTIVGLFVVSRVLPSSTFSLPTGVLLDQLRYGFPLGVAVAVSMSNRLIDKWFVAAFRGDDFGVYAVAAQEIPLLAVLPYAGGAALVTALVDAFRQRDHRRARDVWVGLTASMSVVVVPVGVAVVLLAPELMPAAFTADFRAGVVPFQLFTLITLHRVAEYGMLLRAAGRTRDLLVVAFTTLAANTVLAGVGAAMAGMVGASLGTVIASGIGWWIALRRIATILRVPIRQSFAWRTWTSTVVLSTVAAGVAQLAADALAPMTSEVLLRVGVKSVVFALMVLPCIAVIGRHSARWSALVVDEGTTGARLDMAVAR